MCEEFVPGLVSVILPTFNRAHLLKDAINSVWAQTYRPIELIVVDDGSTDNTQKILDQWRQAHAEDFQFTLIVSRQENKGAPAARNLGLIQSKGEYIQFLDSDDVLHPEKIALHVGAMQRHLCYDYLWSYGVEVVCEGSMATFSWPFNGFSSEPKNSDALDAPPNAVFGLFRREACLLLGPWNETLVRYQDWEYIARACSFGLKLGVYPGMFYAVRIHFSGRIYDLGVNNASLKPLKSLINALQYAENNWHHTGREPLLGVRIGREYFKACCIASRNNENGLYRRLMNTALYMANPNIPLKIRIILFDLSRSFMGHKFATKIYLYGIMSKKVLFIALRKVNS